MGTGEWRRTACRQVHHSVCSEVDGGMKLAELFVDVGREGGVTDVGVDLAERLDADGHGFELGVIDVGRDDHGALGDLRANEFGGDLLLVGDVGHLFGDLAESREVHLTHVPVAGAQGFFLALDDPILARFRDVMAVAVLLFRGS
jgi:hypothetical protein